MKLYVLMHFVSYAYVKITHTKEEKLVCHQHKSCETYMKHKKNRLSRNTAYTLCITQLQL